MTRQSMNSESVAETSSTVSASATSSTPLLSSSPRSTPTYMAGLTRNLSRRVSEMLEKPPPPSPSPHTAPPPSPLDSTIFLDSPLRAGQGDLPEDPENDADSSPIPLQSSNDPPPRRRRRLVPLVKRLRPSLVLENSGSVARDHLASERTFLAYVRTSLAITSSGVALVQLFTIASNTTANSTTDFLLAPTRIQAYARPIGATTVLFGLIVLAIGVVRYFAIQTALTKGRFPVARIPIAGITVFLGALVAVVFGILVSGRR